MSICQFRTLATEIVVERLLKQAGEIMPKLASKVPKLHRSNMEQVRFESELNPMQKVVSKSDLVRTLLRDFPVLRAAGFFFYAPPVRRGRLL